MKTFRIFVSSTFSDFKGERDTLQRTVFPRLRDLCLAHGARFQAVDLRWGVSDEAGHAHDTMWICLGEIARCQQVTPRPNFVVLLGERYGWRPLPDAIPVDEYESILHQLPADSDGERCRDLVAQWYRRDDNAVPPVYVLQPRTGDFSTYTAWEPVERALRTILLETVAALPLAPDQRLKYVASATAQEIAHGALSIPDAHEHVFCFFRTIRDLPLDQSAQDFIDLNPDGHPDGEYHALLDDLKRQLELRLPGNIQRYEARWTGSGITTDHIPQLCDDVYACLARTILAELDQQEQISPLDYEIAAHLRFGRQRAQHFVGRVADLAMINDYRGGSTRHPLAIVGTSGVGKSTLLARAIQDVPQDMPLIARFIGVTPGSSDIRTLLTGLCAQIAHTFDFTQQQARRLAALPSNEPQAEAQRAAIAAEYTIPDDMQQLSRRFQEFLAKVPSEQRLMIVLDALDQLSAADQARALVWLPTQLPEQVRLVVSTGPGECLHVLEGKLPAAGRHELSPMPREEGTALLDLWLASVRRTLQPWQREEVMSKFATTGLPLYLRLAFEQARHWSSSAPHMFLSADILGVIHDLLAQLAAPAAHGPLLVSRSLGYLAAAKNGLTEDELMDVLSRDTELYQDFLSRAHHQPPEQHLPIVVWSRLYFDLEPYLSERSADGATLLAFFHRQLQEVVEAEYLAGEAWKYRHQQLADYFAAQPLQIEQDGTAVPNRRKLSELPYQQMQGQLWDELELTLTDLTFLETKCSTTTIFEVLRDFRDAITAMPPPARAYHQVIHTLQRALDENSYVLNEDPSLLVQQVYNWGSWDAPNAFRQKLHEAAARSPRIWLKRLNRSTSRAPGHRVLSAHTNRVSFVAFAPDGTTVVSGTQDGGQVIVWDAQTGELQHILGWQDVSALFPNGIPQISTTSPDGQTVVRPVREGIILGLYDVENGALLQELYGHMSFVTLALFSPNGEFVASASVQSKEFRGRVILWNVQKNLKLEIPYPDTDGITTMAFSPDSRTLACGTKKANVDLWHVQTGQLLQTLDGHSDAVTALAFSPDGATLASGSNDTNVILWDLSTVLSGEVPQRQTLDGHQLPVLAAAFSPDGKILATGSQDRTAKLWDVKTGELRRTLGGYRSNVGAVAFSPDGKLLASGSAERRGGHFARPGEILLWNTSSGELKCTLELHGTVMDPYLTPVLALACSPDGTTIVSGEDGGSVRLWNAETGLSQRVLTKHNSALIALAFDPAGTTIATATENRGSTDRVWLWNVQSGTVERTLQGSNWIRSIAFSPDGTLVAGGADQSVTVWNVQTGAVLHELSGSGSGGWAVAFSPNGTLLASGSKAGRVCLWDVETGTLLAWLPCADAVLAVWFDSTGSQLRVADAGGAERRPHVYILEIMRPPGGRR